MALAALVVLALFVFAALLITGESTPRFEPAFGSWYEGKLIGIGTVEAHLGGQHGRPFMEMAVLQNGIHHRDHDSTLMWFDGSRHGDSFVMSNYPEAGTSALIFNFKVSDAGLRGTFSQSNAVETGFLLKTTGQELLFDPPAMGLAIHGRGAQMKFSASIPAMGQTPFERAADGWLRGQVMESYHSVSKESRPDFESILEAMWHGGLSWSTEDKASWRVWHEDADCISLLCEYYNYSGGAHGNTGFQTINFYWANGQLHEYQLGSFFKDPQWRGKLVNLIQADLVRQGATWPEIPNVATAVTNQTCVLDAEGMEFQYSPYEVGPYAEGAYQSKILWKDIQPMLWHYRPGRLPLRKGDP